MRHKPGRHSDGRWKPDISESLDRHHQNGSCYPRETNVTHETARTVKIYPILESELEALVWMWPWQRLSFVRRVKCESVPMKPPAV